MQLRGFSGVMSMGTDSKKNRPGRKRKVRIAAAFVGFALVALLLGGAWMKGWLGVNRSAEAGSAKETVYDLGNGVQY
jgi:hypothetical protein